MLDRKDPNFQAGDATHFGVLRLFLRDRSYSWEFVEVGGKVVDRGGPNECDRPAVGGADPRNWTGAPI
jgi:hypothetical protein